MGKIYIYKPLKTLFLCVEKDLAAAVPVKFVSIESPAEVFVCKH